MATAAAVHEDDPPVEGWDDVGQAAVTWKTLLSADRTPTAGMTAGVCVIAGGERQLALHRHAQDETYYFLAGTGRVHVGDQAYDVRAGSCVFIPGGAWHGTVNTSDGELRLFYCFATDSFADVVYEFPDGSSWRAPSPTGHAGERPAKATDQPRSQ